MYSAPRDYLTCDACAKHLRHTINTHVIMRYPNLLNQGIRAPSDDDDADDDKTCTLVAHGSGREQERAGDENYYIYNINIILYNKIL